MFPSHFSWCQRRMRRPTRGKSYKKKKYDIWPSMRYPLRRSVNLLMKYGQILYFVFNRKHALNTIIYSVLRSLWSGISCYSSNRYSFFIHHIFHLWIPLHFPCQTSLRNLGRFRNFLTLIKIIYICSVCVYVVLHNLSLCLSKCYFF